MEIWKDIPGYEGRYQVSDHGRVRSPKKVLSVQPQNSGYLVAHLHKDGHRKVALVHRLVACAFVPGEFVGGHVDHINGDKLDNSAKNLEWVTRSENMYRAYAKGLTSAPKKAVIGVCAVTGAKVVFASQLAAEKALSGKASSAVHHCLAGKKKSAYGYVWSRA